MFGIIQGAGAGMLKTAMKAMGIGPEKIKEVIISFTPEMILGLKKVFQPMITLPIDVSDFEIVFTVGGPDKNTVLVAAVAFVNESKYETLSVMALKDLVAMIPNEALDIDNLTKLQGA
jgi:hypothetical protein